MKTLDEKFNFNLTEETGFSHGYCTGVKIYRNYKTDTPAERKKHKAFIDDMNSAALKGHSYAKGVMCGVRDAANDRKKGRK